MTVATVAPASAAEVISSGRDDRGDVRILESGLSHRNKVSIDLRKATITRVSEKRFRFTVKIRRVAARKARWDQMFFFTMSGRSDDETASVGFSQKPRGGAYASTHTDNGDTWCDLVVRRDRDRHRLSVTVPQRCMPSNRARVRLAAYTGLFRSNAPPFSIDRAKLTRIRY